MEAFEKVLLFLGAGASAEAGLPTTAMVTRHFETFAVKTSRPSAALVESVFRLVQVEVATAKGIAPSSVDFEDVLGILLDAAEGRDVVAAKNILRLLEARFPRLKLDRLVRDLVLYVRGLFLPVRDVSYLDVLLDLVWAHEGTIATLNYDVAVERRHRQKGRQVKTGFGADGRWVGFETADPGIELLKLHGSVHWLRRGIVLDDAYSVLEALISFSEPFLTGLHKTAAWVAGERDPGVRLLMNIGLSKEQLYVTPPFSEIVTRFRARLGEVDIIVVVGYSFRDAAINRMFVEGVRRHPVPVVVVDPDGERLSRARPVLQALLNYGVLVQCAKPVGQVGTSDVDAWLKVKLALPSDGLVRPPDHEDRSLINRVHDLAVELWLLEDYLRAVLGEIEAGRAVVSGLLVCLVQSLERCRETYFQAIIACGRNVSPELTWQVAEPPETVVLDACRGILRNTQRSLSQIVGRIDGWLKEGTVSAELPGFDEEGELTSLLSSVIAALRRAGVVIPP